MRRLTILMCVLTFLALALGAGVVHAQAPTPVTRHQFRTDGLPLSGAFDMVHQILLFPPSASTPVHTHPGLLLVTVIEGQLTFRVDGTEKLYNMGESFTEMPGHVAQARNATAANTSVLVSYVLPDGAPLSVPQPDDTTPLPRPTPGYQFRTDGLAVPGAYEVAQVILDFVPGAATPWHTHPGEVLVTVLEGTNTFSVNGVEKQYKAGESFVELPNELVQARNDTSARMSVMATYLLPKGEPLSHPMPAPGGVPAPAPVPVPAPAPAPQPVELPNTGDRPVSTPLTWVPLIAGASLLVVAGLRLRRKGVRV